MSRPDRADASVIICAHTMNRWDVLCKSVESVREQHPGEIIVVIDHNDELFAKATATFDCNTPGTEAVNVKTTVIANSGRKGLSSGRNTGIARSQGSIVVFIDDDAEACDGWLDALLAPFADATVGAVGGKANPADPAAFPSWWPHEFDWVVGCSWTGLPTRVAEVRNVIGCCMAFRRSIIDDVGGFDPSLGRVGVKNAAGGEETELCIRMRRADSGVRVMYEPRAAVLHHVEPSRLRLGYFVRRCTAEGRSKAVIHSTSGSSAFGPEAAHVTLLVRRSVIGIVRAAIHRDKNEAGRAITALAGLACTATSFVYARISLRLRKGEAS